MTGHRLSAQAYFFRAIGRFPGVASLSMKRRSHAARVISDAVLDTSGGPMSFEDAGRVLRDARLSTSTATVPPQLRAQRVRVHRGAAPRQHQRG